MPYETDLVKCCHEIENARAAVVKATEAYRAGGSVNALNTANRRLADAQNDYYACAGGLVPDRR
jgi:hypothetical protein